MLTPVRMPGFIREYYGLPKAIYILFIGRIVNRMGDFVGLFLVLYLTSKLGYSEAAAGRFIMLTGLFGALGVLAGGSLADIFGRKTVYIGFYLVFALMIGACGFFSVSMAVPWLIFLSSPFRSAVRPIANSMVTDLTNGLERKKAFSLLYLGTNIGVAVGPLIAGFLFNHYLSWIFWGDAVTTFFAIAMVLFFVPDSKPDETEIQRSMTSDLHNERAEPGRAVMVLLRRPVLLTFVLLTLLSNIVYAQHQFSVPLHLNTVFREGGPRMYGFLMTSNAVIVLLFTAPLTILTKHIRPVMNMSVACVLYALGFGLLSFLSGFPLLLVSTLFWTLGEILMVTNSNVFVASHTPMNHRGRFNGIIGLFFGAGFVVTPWISGIYIDAFGTASIWFWVAVFSMLIAGAFLLLRKPAIRTELVPPEKVRGDAG